jgi:hypothetical protein
MPGPDPGIFFCAAEEDAKVKPWHDEKGEGHGLSKVLFLSPIGGEGRVRGCVRESGG